MGPGSGPWSGNGVDPEGLFDPSEANFGNNIITYQYQDNNCLIEDQMVITILELTPVDAGGDQESCVDGAVFQITGGSPSNGTWTSNNGGVIIGNNTFDPTASGSGIYTLNYSITDGNNCSNIDSKIIVIHDLPNVDAGPDELICENPFDVTLTGYSPSGGTWSGTGVTPNGIFNASNTPGLGNYALLVRDVKMWILK